MNNKTRNFQSFPNTNRNITAKTGSNSTKRKQKVRFSIRNKLISLFGLLITITATTAGIFAVQIARTAVIEQIEMRLTEKVKDTAEIIDTKLIGLLQLLEGIAQTPVLRDKTLSFPEKARIFAKEAAVNTMIEHFGVCDLHGNLYAPDGNTTAIGDRTWFQNAAKGNSFVSEPHILRMTNKIQLVFAVTIYDEDHIPIGVLSAAVPVQVLTDMISDIVIGETGYCYIVGQSGNIVAFHDMKYISEQWNTAKKAETDRGLEELARLEKSALTSEAGGYGEYKWQGERIIAGYTKLKTNGWGVIIRAPVDEFMGAVYTLRIRMRIIGLTILIITLLIVYFAALRIVRPIQTAVDAFKDIAQGTGDLTVRLPLIGNDEITDLSKYFNRTIEKIAGSIQEVGTNTAAMEQTGTELASNMTETASAVHQISVNIGGVKQQAQTQAARVIETSATAEEIIKSIKQLNARIESQAASVAESSAAVEQMVANIASITQTLDKTNDFIKHLATATADGKETITSSTAITQKIAEESGSLLEASNVIQHIASQTNLLAMNAAIEAAHAGEAGKGFAVVADEIRKLAEESSTQGKTITQTLKVVSGEMETLSASSKVAGEKFNVIFNLSEQVKDMSNRLMDAMREQDNGSREVLEAIKAINTITVEVQSGSGEMLIGGEQIAEEMKKLDELTSIIANSMNEMAAGAVQISNAVQDVNEISQKNMQNIANLAQEVKKFKV